MKYRIIARIEDDSFNNTASEVMGYMVVDENGKTNTGTINKIYDLYRQGKIEGAQFNNKGEVNLKGIDNKLLPIFNSSTFSNEPNVYMIAEQSGDNYVLVNRVDGSTQVLSKANVINGVMNGMFKIGNAKVTAKDIEFINSIVVLCALKKNNNIGYSVMLPTGEIKQVSKKVVLETLIKEKGFNLFNVKVQEGVLKAKDGNLPVVEVKNSDKTKVQNKVTNKEKYGRGICDPKKRYEVCIAHNGDHDIWIKVEDKVLYVGFYAYKKGAMVKLASFKNWADVENKVDVQKYISGINKIVFQNNLNNKGCTLKLACLAGLNYKKIEDVVFEKCFNTCRDRGTKVFTNVEFYGGKTDNAIISNLTFEERSFSNTNIRLIGCGLKFKKLGCRALYKSCIESLEIASDWMCTDALNSSDWKADYKFMHAIEYSYTRAIGTGIRQIDCRGTKVEEEACAYMTLKNFNESHVAFYINEDDKTSSGLYRGLKLLPNAGKLKIVRQDVADGMFAGSNVRSAVIDGDAWGWNVECKVGKRAFKGCSQLEYVGLEVTEIGDRAFAENDCLREVYIGRGLTSMHPEAFAFCKELKCIYCEKGSKVVDIIKDALSKSKYTVNDIEIKQVEHRKMCL